MSKGLPVVTQMAKIVLFETGISKESRISRQKIGYNIKFKHDMILIREHFFKQQKLAKENSKTGRLLGNRHFKT